MRKVLLTEEDVRLSKGILIPYKTHVVEEYLEKKLAEMGYPLQETCFIYDEDFRIERESAKNKGGDQIRYWAEYGKCADYSDIEGRLTVDKKLLKRLSEDPDSISLFCGESSLFLHGTNESDFDVDGAEWTLKKNGEEIGKVTKLCEWTDFKDFLDEVVGAFVSGD